MREEPPSTEAQSEIKLGLVKKIKNYFRELYIKLSYKPLDQEELTSVLRDAEENNVTVSYTHLTLPTKRIV